MAKDSDSEASAVQAAGALVLKVLIWAILLWWLSLWFFQPTTKWMDFNNKVADAVHSKIYGTPSGYLLLLDAPVFVIVILSAVYLQIRPSNVPNRLEKERRPRVSLRNYPVIVRGPLGIVSAAELLGLAFSAGMLAYIFGVYLNSGFDGVGEPSAHHHHHSDPQLDRARWLLKIDSAGHRTGHLGLVAMAFLFFPVTRGSVLLRLFNIPFERATKYHKWMANIMMVTLVAHGVVYYVLWGSEQNFWEQMSEWLVQFRKWNKSGINNLAGSVSTLAGVLIWVTSLPQVRNRWFEVFFITHQLYTVFVVFGAIHVGEKMFNVCMAGIFLFALDRFLRFLQSRKSVGLLSTRNLPGASMELVFAKHPGLKYTAASFIFLRVPALSRWQWHPFTITSSSQTQSAQVSILVKCQGKWTNGLRDMIEAAPADIRSRRMRPFGFQAAMEGPYGEERDEFSRYGALIFVAGGSGISPFVSVLQEMVCQGQTRKAPNVTLIWAVRTSAELQVLDTVLPHDFFPRAACLNLTVQAYVTREQSSDAEVLEGTSQSGTSLYYYNQAGMEPLCPEAGKDNNWGIIAVLLASLAGYLAIWALTSVYYIEPTEHHMKSVYPSWATALFSMLCMLLGIIVFGGGTVLLLSHLGSSRSSKCLSNNSQIPEAGTGEDLETVKRREKGVTEGVHILQYDNVHFGLRPNLKEIFTGAAKRHAGNHVGVFVCGPQGLLEDVAYQCQLHSSILSGSVALHFHPVSFEL